MPDRLLCILRRAALFGVLAWPAITIAQTGMANAPAAIRFGMLPVGGAVESRDDWTPLLADLGRSIGRPVTVLSVGSFESLAEAVRRNEIDLALLSGKLALDAVSERRMTVLVKIERHEGVPDHRAVLLVRKAGPFNSLEKLVAAPEHWRLARGESRSVTGFIVPQLQFFMPHGIAMETRFRSEIVGTHQATALAVANGDADVATNNTTDLERFKARFPVEAERLQVIWQSEPTPPALILMRHGHSPALQKKVQTFLVEYGKGKGARADAEREVLKTLHASMGYTAADNGALLHAARLEYQFAKQGALNAQWVNEAAREARLARIETHYAEQLNALRETGP